MEAPVNLIQLAETLLPLYGSPLEPCQLTGSPASTAGAICELSAMVEVREAKSTAAQGCPDSARSLPAVVGCLCPRTVC